jgi:hypothetical protein
LKDRAENRCPESPAATEFKAPDANHFDCAATSGFILEFITAAYLYR